MLKHLAYALKIAINIVYGLTSAKFDNPFRDIRNKDNIVAKRGALFMIELKHALQERGLSGRPHQDRLDQDPQLLTRRSSTSSRLRRVARIRLRARGDVRQVLSRERCGVHRQEG